MRKVYPRDINREQFEQIRPLLESVRKQTKPRTVDLYAVFLWRPVFAEERLPIAHAALAIFRSGEPCMLTLKNDDHLAKTVSAF